MWQFFDALQLKNHKQQGISTVQDYDSANYARSAASSEWLMATTALPTPPLATAKASHKPETS